MKIVIDELREKKTDKPKGRFLLTGSANIMALFKLSDPLVGRMSILILYPISGAEAVSSNGDFIDKLFNKDFFLMTKNINCQILFIFQLFLKYQKYLIMK